MINRRVASQSCLLALIFVVGTIAQVPGTWTLIDSPNPSPSTSRLTGVAALNANDAWAVGHHVTGGLFENLAMRWDGTLWTVVPTPRVPISSTNQLKKVVALSSNNVWAIGGHQFPYTMNWNGSAWSVLVIPAVPNGNNPTLSDISALAPNDIWVVGNYGNQMGGVSTFTMHWDGTAWTRVPSPNMEVVPGSPRTSFLHSVEAISANNVWAVGEYLVGGDSFPLIEHWNGTNWSIVPSPNHPTTGDGRLFGISANSANDIWAVGEHDVTNFNNFGRSFAMHWNGSQWTVVTTPQSGTGSGTSRLSAVEALSANNVWAVGTARNTAQGLSTFIIHWNGLQWSRVTSPNVPPENNTGWNMLHDISAVSASDIWTVGYGQSAFNAPNVTITQRYFSAPVTLPANSFIVVDGQRTGGGIPELAASDDTYLSVTNPASPRRASPIVQVQFETIAPEMGVGSVVFGIESNASAAPAPSVLQRIELFNFTSGQWTTVSVASVTSADSVKLGSITSGASDYIETGSRVIRSRVTWFHQGRIFTASLTANIDHVNFTINP